MAEFKKQKDIALIAVDRFREELASSLYKSADLYVKVYATDDETLEWADATLSEW